MFKKLFGKEEVVKDIEIKAPITGEYVQIESIPDPVFAQKMMGDGFGIEPSEGLVVSPVDGEIVNVFPTKHAIGIKTANEVEILIHVGLETVAMNGEGFTTKVNVGDKVQVGDELLEFDIELIKEKASSTVSPVIITNGEVVEQFDIVGQGSLVRGETTVAKVVTK
ncbi:PTS glucose transporter subunit IIA [Macrococcus brunensis]|uniref:PTS system glucose-specific EIIA component n=1 Tax=Macrococcus brunensis TaxID=198483 RepID=A0A4V3BDD9_9STAP|nr:PTS glucose transporter subunit IIA [Macrococcus brunensis]TDL95577.1 PTS glucose transporter subunit IIA [Macrococcus brunensis]ULG70977.1 PTS glucose transporter subunit IIA [Macrococcus brunensis]ULG73314.1 PTS glucose transporter subunit IIA [Macrococcus brunensis]